MLCMGRCGRCAWHVHGFAGDGATDRGSGAHLAGEPFASANFQDALYGFVADECTGFTLCIILAAAVAETAWTRFCTELWVEFVVVRRVL